VLNYIEENANKLRMRSLKGITGLTIRKMDDDLMAKGLSRSSIYNYHKMLKYWLGVAVEEGYIGKSPYEGLKLDKGKHDDIKYLTDAEREKVEKFKCEGTIAKVRDMFLLACYTGLSYSDMSKIDPQDFTHDGERIKLRSRRIKTGGLYSITILPKAKEILERYGWSVPNISNQKCNQYLKAIQSACGIRTKLTMHVGRHTFATWALQKGVQIEVVSKMLGHSSINTTQIYAKVLQQSVDAGFDSLV
jgi:site-specific recombinase XerD